MLTYYQRVCDRKGTTLREERLEAPDLRHAMAQVNRRLCSIRRATTPAFDPNGRIEIADCDGRPVARIYCAEVMPVPPGPR